MNEIEEFIKRRFGSTDAKWRDGNCYYFAIILTHRFPELEIYYEGIDGHFWAGDGENFYDHGGKNIPYSEPIKFEELRKRDPLWYANIVRDCVM